jgi:hypothetical protein
MRKEMPNAILDIGGWQKKVNIPTDSWIKGFVEIYLEKPMSCIIPLDRNVSSELNVTRVMLRYVGNDIFKFEA